MSLRRIALAGALGAALVAPGLARAERDQGNGEIAAVHLEQNTLEINGKSFRVSESTAIEDKEGHKIELMQVPSHARGASSDQAAAWYEAEEGDARGAQLLYRLKLTGRRPQ